MVAHEGSPEAQSRHHSRFLPGARPAWIGEGKYYSQDMADYVVKFIQGAKRVHDLDIANVGIWNERPYDVNWIKLLRRTFDQDQLNGVHIVAAEEINQWKIVGEMSHDDELRAAIYAVGVHYPQSKSPEAAQACGKPLWFERGRAVEGHVGKRDGSRQDLQP